MSNFFLKLSKRGAPKYLILLLDSWYSSQRLFVKWGQIISPGFGMSNGIRQGSKLSPHLFNVYIDQLSLDLQNSRVGCHIAGKAANHFGYADDLALIAPSVKGLNALLEICDRFAKRNDIIYSTIKSKCMMIHAGRRPSFVPPPVYLSNDALEYVESFRYLDHIITTNFRDDSDIEREIKSLNIRGNIIVRKFGFLQKEVKCELFRAYCYPLYTCALWANFNQSSIKRLKVAYNNIMRRLVYVAPWQSASHMFGSLGVRSFDETIRVCSYKLRERVGSCENKVLRTLCYSDAALFSKQRVHWRLVLYR